MRAYEIPGWLDGKKICRDGDGDGEYTYFDKEGGEWLNEYGKNSVLCEGNHFFYGTLFGYDDWKEYKERK